MLFINQRWASINIKRCFLAHFQMSRPKCQKLQHLFLYFNEHVSAVSSFRKKWFFATSGEDSLKSCRIFQLPTYVRSHFEELIKRQTVSLFSSVFTGCCSLVVSMNEPDHRRRTDVDRLGRSTARHLSIPLSFSLSLPPLESVIVLYRLGLFELYK